MAEMITSLTQFDRKRAGSMLGGDGGSQGQLGTPLVSRKKKETEFDPLLIFADPHQKKMMKILEKAPGNMKEFDKLWAEYVKSTKNVPDMATVAKGIKETCNTFEFPDVLKCFVQKEIARLYAQLKERAPRDKGMSLNLRALVEVYGGVHSILR
ncbi:MAG: hypothetical protein AB1468_03530, partial [Candidatus Micrarchaeota archaeon]